MTEFLDSRVDRLDSYLDAHGLDAIWFARPNSFKWLTGGDNVVDYAGDVGVAAAGYDGDLRLVTDNIEAPRLVDEEVPDEFSVETVQWYESSLADAVAETSPTPAAADFDVPGFDSVDAASLRQPLTEHDIEVYRSLARDAAAAVESVARQLEAGDTEHEVAAALRVALSARDLNAPVVLVGGEDRAQQYRHYTPQVAELGGYALLSVTAERNGLHASLTRTVAFDAPEWLEARQGKAATVDVSALGATQEAARQNGTAGDVFSAIQDAYDAVGFDGEWQHHHQGGAAGFAGREWIATPTSDDSVHAPMAYAWNPTVQGAKSEDTVLVTDDGFETLTTTGDWETQSVESADGGVELDRHTVLHLD
jgi:Xaa-Pro aminopeptidase